MATDKPNQLALAKREAMVDMAIQVIAEGGLSALTFRRLAEVAGTSTAPFTTEFGTREEMLKAVLEKTWLDLALKEEDLPADDVLDRLRKVLLRATPASEPVAPELLAYLDLLVASTHNPALGETLRGIERRQTPAYLELIKEVQAAGHISASRKPEDLLAGFWALSDGLLLAYAIDPEAFPPARVMEIWEASFAALIA